MNFLVAYELGFRPMRDSEKKEFEVRPIYKSRSPIGPIYTRCIIESSRPAVHPCSMELPGLADLVVTWLNLGLNCGHSGGPRKIIGFESRKKRWKTTNDENSLLSNLFYLWLWQTCKVEEDRSLALRIIQIGREVLRNSKISKASAHIRPGVDPIQIFNSWVLSEIFYGWEVEFLLAKCI